MRGKRNSHLASRAQWRQEVMTWGGPFVLPCKGIGSDVGRKIAFRIRQRTTFACDEGVLRGQHAGLRVKKIDGRTNTKLRNKARQHGGSIQVSEVVAGAGSVGTYTLYKDD